MNLATNHKQLEHLLDLKQKQANVWEARSSREGAEETATQGNVWNLKMNFGEISYY
jgi:hypothetical protein